MCAWIGEFSYNVIKLGEPPLRDLFLIAFHLGQPSSPSALLHKQRRLIWLGGLLMFLTWRLYQVLSAFFELTNSIQALFKEQGVYYSPQAQHLASRSLPKVLGQCQRETSSPSIIWKLFESFSSKGNDGTCAFWQPNHLQGRRNPNCWADGCHSICFFF